jgi:hypothetical protein
MCLASCNFDMITIQWKIFEFKISVPYGDGDMFLRIGGVTAPKVASALTFSNPVVTVCTPPDECQDSIVKLGYYRFFPHPFQFIIRLSLSH